MTLFEILAILFIHWIADFVIQTEEQAINKSKSMKYLISHTFEYSMCFAAIAFCITVIYMIITRDTISVTYNFLYWFLPITFVCHTITDYFTSRLNKKLAPRREELKSDNPAYGGKVYWYPRGEKWHNFFVSVGFDQFLHYVQLFLTYYLLK